MLVSIQYLPRQADHEQTWRARHIAYVHGYKGTLITSHVSMIAKFHANKKTRWPQHRQALEERFRWWSPPSGFNVIVRDCVGVPERLLRLRRWP